MLTDTVAYSHVILLRYCSSAELGVGNFAVAIDKFVVQVADYLVSVSDVAAIGYAAEIVLVRPAVELVER